MKHPARYTESIMDFFHTQVQPEWLVLDPFAGSGRIHELDSKTVSLELEHEWAAQGNPAARQAFRIIGNARFLPFGADTFDAVFSSPTYGNRMADHHNARDGSRRITYTHTLGRTLHPDNSGAMQWGPQYRLLHEEAWAEVRRVLKPGHRFFLNVSDHIRKGEVQQVTHWHQTVLEVLGFVLVESVPVATPRMKFGANYALRVDCETVLIMEKPCTSDSQLPSVSPSVVGS